jgi:hypothetical protein
MVELMNVATTHDANTAVTVNRDGASTPVDRRQLGMVQWFGVIGEDVECPRSTGEAM